MTGPAVVAVCLVASSLLVAAYLIGVGQLDGVLARWNYDREVRESVRAEEAKRAALAGPRSVPEPRR